MRQLVLTLVILFSACFALQAQDQERDAAKKLGLVSYLTFVKSTAEYKMITLSQQPAYQSKEGKTLEFNAAYNNLKLEIDQLINQISADLYQKNGLGLYKAIDSYIKNATPLPVKFKKYEPLLISIQGKHGALLFKSYGSSNGFAFGDILGTGEKVYGAIADARDFREKKIQSITALLKELKVTSLGTLLKPAEK